MSWLSDIESEIMLEFNSVRPAVVAVVNKIEAEFAALKTSIEARLDKLEGKSDDQTTPAA